jgi:hypothetical protein
MDSALLERQLNHPTPAVRHQALDDLLAAQRAGTLASFDGARRGVNLHCHTTYSYNGYGYSPTGLAWLAHQQGWYALGTVDFDVLDAVDETLEACHRVGVRACAGIETRVFCGDQAKLEFNSPGEPGVIYYVGLGFTASQPSPQARSTLQAMRDGAKRRNIEMVERINRYLDPVTVGYARDVLPLTPAGNATERHILVAYDIAARRLHPSRQALVSFWAGKLDMPAGSVERFLGDEPFPHDAIRSKLMKRGGVGYVQPGPDAFPSLETAQEAILACGAIPSYAFLDGSSEGEQRLPELLERLIAQGMGALTIVPDRNWNIADAREREQKVAKLHETMALADALDLPVIVGTEMNKHGQRLIDDFRADALRPYKARFERAADWIHGHTMLQAARQIGFASAWAQDWLPERAARNAFYAHVGRALTPGQEIASRLPQSVIEAGPASVLAWAERKCPLQRTPRPRFI